MSPPPPPPSCPHGGRFSFQANKPRTSPTLQDWWPNRLDLSSLHRQHGDDPNAPPPRRTTAASLDTTAVVRDVQVLLRQSVDWWPADYGHYGGLFVRLAWHAAGTYRVTDGRGGSDGGRIRLAPLNSWPDNANLDKAVRLLWPVKRKYGAALSWADLIVLSGTVALQDMGLPMFGFGFGRRDEYTAHDDTNWGPEGEWLADERHTGASNNNSKVGDSLANPLGAVQMGLIYVNPEGPGGNPDPRAAAHDIRTTFARMAMNDAETVALIAGGHTFGKAHGAAAPDVHVGPNPEGAPTVQQGLGWKNSYQSGSGADTITSGLEGAWTAHPTRWDSGYLENLFRYEWKPIKSPAGATQWIPTDPSTYNMVPDAHYPSKRHAPVMFTTDLALRYDPAYAPIARRFYQNPGEFQTAFAKAWYKLTHKDVGPRTRLWGPLVPPAQLWQDPLPAVTHALIQAQDVRALQRQILAGLDIATLVRTAWASASTFRITDHRGGANGARIRLAPQNAWPVNDPAELSHVLTILQGIQDAFNSAPERAHDKKQISLADLIVLGGNAAIDAAAHKAGYDKDTFNLPFIPGRTDATANDTDVESFDYLKPFADGFRNWVSPSSDAAAATGLTEEQLLVEKAYMLQLSASEMTVLVGGMRVLGANASGGGSNRALGVLTKRPQVLSNDFFVNLLDMSVTWQEENDKAATATNPDRTIFRGVRADEPATPLWRASKVDLIFGSHSELRAIAEYYAADDGQDAFVQDFCAAWTKVMNNDRYDVDPENPGVHLSRRGGNMRSHSRL